MKKTDNYSLPQWEKQDFIKMEDFNDAFAPLHLPRRPTRPVSYYAFFK